MSSTNLAASLTSDLDLQLNRAEWALNRHFDRFTRTGSRLAAGPSAEAAGGKKRVLVKHKSRWREGVLLEKRGQRYHVRVTARETAWFRPPNVLEHMFSYAPGENTKASVKTRDFETSGSSKKHYQYSILVYGFASGSAAVPNGLDNLILAYMRQKLFNNRNTNLYWNVEGFTDAVGKASFNSRLKTRRAKAVKSAVDDAVFKFLAVCPPPAPAFYHVKNLKADQQTVRDKLLPPGSPYSKKANPATRELFRSALVTFMLAGGGQKDFNSTPGRNREREQNRLRRKSNVTRALKDMSGLPKDISFLVDFLLRNKEGSSSEKWLDVQLVKNYGGTKTGQQHYPNTTVERYVMKYGHSAWATVISDVTSKDAAQQKLQTLRSLKKIAKEMQRAYAYSAQGASSHEGRGFLAAVRAWLDSWKRSGSSRNIHGALGK